MKLYIAGPMTGIPQFNIPAFDAEAAAIRALPLDESIGTLEVVSPAELDDPAIRAISLASEDGTIATLETHGQTWGDFLSRDVKLLADGDFDGIVVLPDWHKSRGARLETFVGFLAGLAITYRDGENFYLVPFEQLAQAWSSEEGWVYLNGYFADHYASQFTDEPFTVVKGGAE